MTARRIARELAVIMMPQLPKDKKRLEKLEFDTLLSRSVQLLTEHARQCLSEAGGYLSKAESELNEIELEHPDNAGKIADVRPVNLKSSELKEQIALIETALNLVTEALDIPEMAICSDYLPTKIACKSCGKEQKLHLKKAGSGETKQFVQELLGSYMDHSKEIDEIISAIKTKWSIERMVSIDRDILRLACTEAFYLPEIPLRVAFNEAIELARRFADDRAAKFINGVLGDLSEHAEAYRETGELKLDQFGKDKRPSQEAVR